MDSTDFMIQNINLLAQYMELDTLWKMRGISKRFLEFLNGRIWWNLVKQEAQDPPLNPYTDSIDWFSVVVALKLSPQKLERLASTRTISQLTSSGLKLLDIGKPDAAAVLLVKAYDKSQEKTGPKTTEGKDLKESTKEQADCAFNLSLARGMLGEIDNSVSSTLGSTNIAGAFSLRQVALAIYKQVCGEESEEVAKTLFAIGDAHYAVNHLDEAQKHYEESLKLRLKLFGEQSEQVAQSNCGLALLLAKKGNNENEGKAIQLFENALEIRKRLFGDISLQSSRIYFNLGAIYARKKENKKLISECFRKAFEGRANCLGPTNPQTIRAQGLYEHFSK